MLGISPCLSSTFPGTPSSTTLTASSSGTPFSPPKCHSKAAVASQSAPLNIFESHPPSTNAKDLEKPLAGTNDVTPSSNMGPDAVGKSDVTASGDFKTEFSTKKRIDKTKHKARKSLKTLSHASTKDLGRWKPHDDLLLINAVQQVRITYSN